MHRTTIWRQKQKENSAPPDSEHRRRRGPKGIEHPMNGEWLAFSGAVIAQLRERGEVVAGLLKKSQGNDWPENRLHYEEPPSNVADALATSKIPPCCLAFAAAEFGRVTVIVGRLDPLKPRRENFRAPYWKSIPGFNKELAAHCRNRAPKRKEAVALICRLAGCERPQHQRENETRRWSARDSAGSLLNKKTRALLPPAAERYVDRLLNAYMVRRVYREADLVKLSLFGERLIRRVIREAVRKGWIPVVSESEEKKLSATRQKRSDSLASGEVELTSEDDGFGWQQRHADEIDARLGWTEKDTGEK